MGFLSSLTNIGNSVASFLNNVTPGNFFGNFSSSSGLNFPIGQGLTPQAAAAATAKLTPSVFGVVPGTNLTQESQDRILNPDTPAAQRIAETTVQQSGGSTGQFGGTTPTTPPSVYQLPLQNYGPPAKPDPVSGASGATGGSSGQSFSDPGSGISGHGGGAAPLPGSIGGGGRMAGGVPYSLIPDEDKKKVVAIRAEGSFDLFDPQSGLRLTPEQAAARGAFTDTPGQLSDRVGIIQGQTPRPTQAFENAAPLTSAELKLITSPVDDFTSEDLGNEPESALNDFKNTIMDMISNNATTIKELNAQIAQNTLDENRIKAQMRDLELAVFGERLDIANDPDFSKNLKQRRDAWLTQSMQSGTVLERIALSNELQAFTDSKSVLIDLKNATNEELTKSLAMFEAFKPDNLKYEVDKNGNLVSIYYDPLTNSVKTQTITSGFGIAKEHGEIKNVQEVGSDTAGRSLVTTYEDGFQEFKHLSIPTSNLSNSFGGVITNLTDISKFVNNSDLAVGQKTTVSASAAAIQNGQDIMDLIGITTTDFGVFAGRTQTQLQKLGIAESDFTTMQSLMTAYTANYVKSISGVAVSEQEFNRLAKALPSVNDTLQVAQDKIRAVEKTMNNSMQSVAGIRYQPGQKVSDMRTDRHNNPTAFTVDVARQAGLVEGVDYVKGDAFPDNPNLFTAKILHENPIDITRILIDRIGFYTNDGQPRWGHTTLSKNVWDSLSIDDKHKVIYNMYQNEGGTKLSNLF